VDIVHRKEERTLDAIIGKYKVRMVETGLVLKHEAGISFELTLDETMGLGDFINAYRQTLTALQSETDRQTEPRMKSIVPDEDDNCSVT